MCLEIYLASLSSARERASKGIGGQSQALGLGIGFGKLARQGLDAAAPDRNCRGNPKAIEAERELSRQFRNYRGRLGIV